MCSLLSYISAHSFLTRPPPSQVDVHQVITVRSALLRADTNLWQPLNFNVRAIGNALGGGGDDEVNRALEQLLVGGNRHQVGCAEGSNCWPGVTAVWWDAGKQT